MPWYAKILSAYYWPLYTTKEYLMLIDELKEQLKAVEPDLSYY